MSFFVDPPGLVMIGAMVFILSRWLNIPRTIVYAFSGGMLATFVFGGVGLYLDWFRWTIPGLIDLKGSYVMLEQGLTGLTRSTFPVWIVILFVSLYPLWFALGYETAKRYEFKPGVVPVLVIGVLLLLVPSIIESQFLVH